MRGAVFLGNRKIEIRNFPDPAPGPGEVVVRMRASGMCGSDLKFYRVVGGAASMGLGKAGEAYFSPDGNTIIFQATPAGQTEYQIYTMDLTSRKPKMVSTGKGACTCAFFHPKARKIMYASSHLDPTLGQPKPPKETKGYAWDFNEYMDIFEADLDGGNLHRLTDAPGYDAEGSYSPNGKQIVFTSMRDGDQEIYVMNADGTDQRRLTNGKGWVAVGIR